MSTIPISPFNSIVQRDLSNTIQANSSALKSTLFKGNSSKLDFSRRLFTRLKNHSRYRSSIQSSTTVTSSDSSFSVGPYIWYSRDASLSASSNSSRNDTYTITLPQAGSFNIGIAGFEKNVDLQLFTLSGTLLASSKRPGNLPESINIESLAKGRYIVKVSLKVPSTDSSAKTNYRMFLSCSNPNNILTDESDLGTLASTVMSYSGRVNSNNTSDIYRFNLKAKSGLTLLLGGLKNNANIRLIKDVNQDNRIGTQDVIASSTEGTFASEEIDVQSLEPGNYFVQVYLQSNNTTNYSLQVVRHATNSLSLRPVADAFIRADLDVRRNDNYGAESILEVGTGRDSSRGPIGTADAMRSLIRFDLSNVSGKLTRATLQLTIDSLTRSATPYNVGVYNVVQPWEEGNGREAEIHVVPNTTNPNLAAGVAWSAIDDNNQEQPRFSNKAIATRLINSSQNKSGDVIEWDITSLVKGWLANPASNYGLVLRDLTDLTTSGEFRELRFGSRETDLYTFPSEVAGPRLNLKFQ